MRSLAAKVVAADDLDGRELWDSALHRAIATVAGNALFLALFDVVDHVRQDETWRHVREALRTEERVSFYTAQHDEVRPEERCVGKECCNSCSCRGAPEHQK